jgi:hypothetical protein
MARAYIDKTLERLGVAYAAHQVSIGRADFCIDILAPDFDLIPDHVVMHSHANRSDHLTSNGKSGKFTSVTAGKMPGRKRSTGSFLDRPHPAQKLEMVS